MGIGRPPSKRLSADALAAAAALVKGGETVQTLASDIDVPYTTLVRWLRSAHPDAMAAHDARLAAAKKSVNERREAVIRLVKGGATVAEAAAELGCSWDDANNALAQEHVRVSNLRPLSKPGPRPPGVKIHRQRRRRRQSFEETGS